VQERLCADSPTSVLDQLIGSAASPQLWKRQRLLWNVDTFLLDNMTSYPTNQILSLFETDCFDNCVGVLIICVLVFTVFCIVCFMYIIFVVSVLV
jgi:hypothetical protein